MLNRLIIFLIRHRLGLKKRQLFKFANQNSRDLYWFNADSLMKFEMYPKNTLDEKERAHKSGVSLNWLLTLDPKGMIKPVKDHDISSKEYAKIQLWLCDVKGSTTIG